MLYSFIDWQSFPERRGEVDKGEYRYLIKVIRWKRIRIKEISWIRNRINLQMKNQNVWNMSLFEHFFKIWAFIWKLGSGSGFASKWKVGSGSTYIKVTSRIRIGINLEMKSQNVWNMSLFEHFFKVLSLYLEGRIRIRISTKWNGRIRISIKANGRIRIRICIKVIRTRNTELTKSMFAVSRLSDASFKTTEEIRCTMSSFFFPLQEEAVLCWRY